MKLNSFEFTFKVGVSVLQVFERSRDSVRSVFLVKVTMSWLLDTIELFQAEGAKEFVKSSRVGSKAFIVQHCANKFDRFLARWSSQKVEAVGGGQALLKNWEVPRFFPAAPQQWT